MKALVWRLFAICNTLTMAIFIAKEISIASKIVIPTPSSRPVSCLSTNEFGRRLNGFKEYEVEYNVQKSGFTGILYIFPCIITIYF